MDHQSLALFLLQLTIILSVALVCGQAMRKLRFPAVLGELIGGIFLGPTIFGSLAPHLHIWLFPDVGQTVIARDVVVRVGLLFFLFTAGLEVNLSYLRQDRLSILFISLFGIVVPFAFGFGLILLLPGLWGPQLKGSVLIFALVIGTILSISALPVIARILIDLDVINKRLGIIVLTAATIDDLIGWGLFMLILRNFAAAEGLIGGNLLVIFLLILGLSVLIFATSQRVKMIIPRLSQIRSTKPHSLISLVIVLILMASLTTETMGIHAIFGAFLMGVALAPLLKREHQIYTIIYQFVLGFFAPLYFVSIGLQINFASNFDLALVLIVLIVACAGKVIGVSFGAWFSGMPLREALVIAFGMNARGAMGIVLATAAFENKLIDERVLVALIIMALVTSMISGPVMQRLLESMPVDEDSVREKVLARSKKLGLENLASGK